MDQCDLDLSGEDADVFAEGLGGADVSSWDALARRARGQLTFLKKQSEQREQGMSGGGEDEEEGQAVFTGSLNSPYP